MTSEKPSVSWSVFVIIFILCFICGLGYVIHWLNKEDNRLQQLARQTGETKRLVTLWTGKLSQLKISNDTEYFTYYGELPKDPWDTPLTVSYSHAMNYDRVEVRSFGPDKLFGTYDDIIDSETINAKKQFSSNIKPEKEKK